MPLLLLRRRMWTPASSSSGSVTGQRATDFWYENIRWTPNGAGLIPECSRSCGSYSTLVWKSSVRLGCGRGTRNDNGGDFVVCLYCAEANVWGGFTENALSPSKTADQCADPYDPSDGLAPTPSVAPTPCLSPSPSEVGLSADWMKELLDTHSTYRCMHGVPLFEWGDAAAASAQAHVDAGEFGLSGGLVGSEYCTELHAWSSEETAAEAAGRWYAEIENSPGGTGAVPDCSSSCTGYTTLVWKSAVRLGCGRGSRNDKGGDCTACYCCPEANSGRFTDGVFPVSKTAKQCASCASDGVNDDGTDGGPSPSPSSDDGPSPSPSSHDGPSPSPGGGGLGSENLDAGSAVQASLAALAVLLLIGVAAIAV
ncbi:unnamed protein product [Prorocentrum cordatum]|uniref:SCP domain-containing protein n=1 Tax=Prorocentrum cordatum TaxID=2364126 RepID=A0ABN9Q0D4_9DINO|nr:unnamed protein product [Polarella glacialis]